MHIDDTTHRILEARPVEKTRNGVTRRRTGVYASALLALVHDPPRGEGERDAVPGTERSIVLFRTDIGHGGEWLEGPAQGRASDTVRRGWPRPW